MPKCKRLDALADSYTIPLPERIPVTYYQWSKWSDRIRILFMVALAVGVSTSYFKSLAINYS